VKSSFYLLQEGIYWGRIILVGLDSSGKKVIVCYALTGRSFLSQARRLEKKGKMVWVRPLSGKKLTRIKKESLLSYPAIIIGDGVVVSNGIQSFDIFKNFKRKKSLLEILSASLLNWSYEPDYPIFTPRIAGCVHPEGKAALGLVKRAVNGSTQRSVFEVPLLPGKGFMIATYDGREGDEPRSFKGEPLPVEIYEEGTEHVARALYEALKPRPGAKDLRIAVCCVFFAPGKADFFILNRFESEGGKDEEN